MDILNSSCRLKVEKIASKFICESYFTTEEWLNIPGKGLVCYHDVEIISVKLLPKTRDNKEATVEVYCSIEVEIDEEGEVEKDEEFRTFIVYLEDQGQEDWFVDNVDEIS